MSPLSSVGARHLSWKAAMLIMTIPRENAIEQFGIQFMLSQPQVNCVPVLLCAGNTVPVDEQVDVKTAAGEGGEVKEGAAPGNLAMATSFVGLAGGGTSAISEAERQQLEADKMALYKQLDDKVGRGGRPCGWCGPRS